MQHLKHILRAAKGGREDKDKSSTPSKNSRNISTTLDVPQSRTTIPSAAISPNDIVTVQHHETTPASAPTEMRGADNYQSAPVAAIPIPSTDPSVTARPVNKKYPGLKTRYQLNKRIGDGAFSVVYHAHDLDGVHPQGVAIKIVHKAELGNKQGEERLHPDFKQGRKAIQRSGILKETAIQKRMKHENIVNLIEHHEDDEYMYIVLEFVPGGELFHHIVKLTYFSEELSRHVIMQVAEAIRYMHLEQGVVHRDIKPENILYTPIAMQPSKVPRPKQPGDEGKVDEGEFIPGVGGGGIGTIKIADFGLSKVVWQNNTKTPCGTAGYTAPEIVREDTYSQGVDMWALGCVLYTVLCGFPPFYDENLTTLSDKVKRGEFTFLSPWWDNISDSAKDLVTHLLVVDPEKRYDIGQFLLHPWITQKEGSVPVRAPPANSGAFHPHNVIDDNGLTFDPRSPDAINLREVFDISYDVARRVQTPYGGVNNILAQLDEEDEEGLDGSGSNSGSDAQYNATGTNSQSLEQSMRNTQIEDSKPRTTTRTGKTSGGYGQHSADVVAAAKRTVKEQAQAGFELNFAGATLLNRRGHTPAAAMNRP